jgi:polysaccharide chain length determinant protein (PEP-CTERM system associated)
MNEFIGDLIFQLRALWRWRWLAAAVAWAVCVLAWLVILVLPNVFEANARVYVDTRTALRPVLQGIAVEQDVDSQLNLVRQALLSRPQLEKVARKTDLDVSVSDAADMDRLVRELRDDIRIDLQTRENEQRATDSLYTISYRHANRDKSLAVVRMLVASFVDDTIGGKRTDTDTAQRFLRDQIRAYEQRLGEAEARLADFKKRNVGLIPGEEGDYFSRLNAQTQSLQRAEADLALAVSRRGELRRQLGSVNPYVAGTFSAAPGSAAPTDVSIRIQESEAKLEELLLRFTDKHPEVVALRDTIRELRAREAKELAELRRGGQGTGAIRSLSSNPVYQNIQLALNQADLDIASLRGAVSQHQSEIAALRRVVDTAPEVEQELARLNRDYGVTKAQYEALVERLEKARVSEDAEQSGIVRFEVIDPPTAAVQPVAPNRALLALAALAGGLLAAFGVALVASQLAPTFSNPRTLESVTGLPVLGSVSSYSADATSTAGAADQRKLMIVFGGLVASCAIIILIGGAGASFLQRFVG